MGDYLAPRLPTPLLTTRRDDCTDVPLPLIEGTLPESLQGHLFIVSPASTVEWGGRPQPRQPPLLNGDGMLCRVDFRAGAAKATCRLARTPCQVADELTHDAPFPLNLLQFLDAGIARLSPLLGARDFINTGWVSICEPGQAPRLLVTYDAGRPYEIDPVTLEVLGPMGAAREWAAETFDQALFPMILSAGHPFYDPATRALFTINYGRALSSMGGSVPHALGKDFWKSQGGMPQSFTDLVRWDGQGALEHWRLRDSAGNDIQIAQSVHQVAVTRNYIVLFDTAFRVGFEQWFNDPAPSSPTLEELIRSLLARPQLPYTDLYLIPRAALGTGSTDPANPTPLTVAKATVPLESGHLLADYDDAGDRVTVHLSHCTATDLREWVRPYDRNYYDHSSPRKLVEGMLATGAMDVNRLGRYVIDGKSGEVLESATVQHDKVTWTVALYAARDVPAVGAAPEKIEHLFWASAGFFPELLTKFVYHLYEDYPNRVTSIEEIQALAAQGGRPSCLFRVDTVPMTIADVYTAPTGVVIDSPQFVARGPGQLEGFIVTTAFTPERMEVWVFDAARLALGPVCKLDASALPFGFSLHTAWLPELAARTSNYRVDIATDAGDRDFSDPVRAFLKKLIAKLA